MADLLNLLTQTKVGDLPQIRGQELVQFTGDDLIRDVFEKLSKCGLHSAPIFDNEKKEYIGMLDLRDFVAFVLSLHKKGGPIVFTSDKLVDFSGVNPFVPIDPNTSVLDALRTFNRLNLHRAPVGDKHKIIGILSQFAIIQWLFQHKAALGPQGDRSVADLEKDLGGVSGMTHLLLHITVHDPVLKGFDLIHQYNVHAVPVLDDNGKIVDNVSVSDLKYLNANVAEYMKQVKPARAVVTCTKADKFVDILKLLAENQVHRTYIVDATGRPVDIITLTNVIETVYHLAVGQKITSI